MADNQNTFETPVNFNGSIVDNTDLNIQTVNDLVTQNGPSTKAEPLPVGDIGINGPGVKAEPLPVGDIGINGTGVKAEPLPTAEIPEITAKGTSVTADPLPTMEIPADVPIVPPEDTTEIKVEVPEPEPEQPTIEPIPVQPEEPATEPEEPIAEEPKDEPPVEEPPIKPLEDVVEPKSQPLPELSNAAVNLSATAARNAMQNTGNSGWSVGGHVGAAADSATVSGGGVHVAGHQKLGERTTISGVAAYTAMSGRLTNNETDSGGAVSLGAQAQYAVTDKTALTASVIGTKVNGFDNAEAQGFVEKAMTVGVGVRHNLTENTALGLGVSRETGKTFDGRDTNATQIGVDASTRFNDRWRAGIGATLGVAGNVDSSAIVGSVGYSRQSKPVNEEITVPMSTFKVEPPTKLTAMPKKEAVPAISITLGEKELFSHDSAKISDIGRTKLDELASKLSDPALLASGKSIQQMLKESGQSINILGNTDATGSNAYNQRLSQSRANNVMQYLESKGIDTSVLKAAGVGESGAKFNDAAVAEMKRSGMSREQIHQKIEGDRNVTITIPGEYALRNDRSQQPNQATANSLGGVATTQQSDIKPTPQEQTQQSVIDAQRIDKETSAKLAAVGIEEVKNKQQATHSLS